MTSVRVSPEPSVGLATTPRRSRPRGRPPLWLWGAALVALVPVLVPFGFLVSRLTGSGSRFFSIALSAETGRLAISTAVLVALVAVSTAVIGVGAAWLTERTDLPGRRLWRVLVALPLVIPSYVIALTLVSASGRGGLLAEATGWAVPSLVGLPGAWIALTIATYPFVYLGTAATLRRLDPAHEESARSLGASQLRVFRTIVIPQLRPALGSGLLLVALYTLSDFGAVSLVRYDSFTRLIYAQYAGRLDRTPAGVLALVLVVIALIVVWAERATRGRAAYHGRPVSRPPRVTRLSPWSRGAALSGLGLLALMSLGLPVGTLLVWLERAPADERFPWGAIAGSVTASTLAALVVAILVVPTAMLITRHASRSTAWVERASYAAFALPHITIGLAVVFFASRYLGSLYQSLTVLVLVYASMFLAQALGSTRASLLQVSPSIEEASRSLGSGRLRTTLQVTAPMVLPGLLAGCLLVFLTTMKELPATLLLRPTGFDTLAVGIWSAADALLYSRAAGPALLLLAVSAIPVYILATRDR